MNYNKVIQLGRLTRKPELRYTPSQTAVVDFGIANSRTRKDAQGNDCSDPTFIDCTMFGKRAEVISKYFDKGDPIFIEGRLSYEKWTAQDGTKRSKLKVMVENFEFVQGSKNREEQPERDGYGQRHDADSVPF
jgi:single-strand DNA-binding protein